MAPIKSKSVKGKAAPPAKRAVASKKPAKRAGLQLVQDADPQNVDATLADKAYDILEEQIVTLKLEPGALLSEFELAKRLNIGRTPIREALQRLAREGLIQILPRRGIVVSQINIHTQLKVLEVRRVLERLMAQRACERASDAQCQTFGELARDIKKTIPGNDDVSFMRLDQSFNQLLTEASGNEFITRAMGLMHGLSRRFWFLHYKAVADLPRAAQLHADVALAISKRDGAAAIKASDALMSYIETFTRQTLDR